MPPSISASSLPLPRSNKPKGPSLMVQAGDREPSPVVLATNQSRFTVSRLTMFRIGRQATPEEKKQQKSCTQHVKVDFAWSCRANSSQVSALDTLVRRKGGMNPLSWTRWTWSWQELVFISWCDVAERFVAASDRSWWNLSRKSLFLKTRP